MSTVRAMVEWAPTSDGVKIAAAVVGGQHTIVTLWDGPFPSRKIVERDIESNDDAMWLHLDEETARAIYEGLARYFGGIGADVRALRSDYDAERKRVDLLIGHLTGGAK